MNRENAEEVLRKIAEHWGKPMPLGSPTAYVANEWRLQCNYVQNLARRYLNLPLIGPESPAEYEARER